MDERNNQYTFNNETSAGLGNTWIWDLNIINKRKL